MRSKYLSREILERDYGVTNITEDGDVYVGEKLMTAQPQLTKHPNGDDKVYLFVNLRHLTAKKLTRHGAKVYNDSRFDHVLLHRAVYAWHSKDHECKAGFTINHDDENSFNNKFSNLSEVSLPTNQKLKSKTGNQYSAKYSYELTLAYREYKRNAIDGAKYYKESVNTILTDLKRLKTEWHEETDPNIKLAIKAEIDRLNYELNETRMLLRKFNSEKTITLAEFSELFGGE